VVAANGAVIGQAKQECGGDENTCSMALLVTYGGFDYLTAGDMTGSIEGLLGIALKERGVNVDVLKVSHHGTCTNGTSSWGYFNNIKPEYAVICGKATSPCASDCGGVTVNRLISTGTKMIYCVPGYSCLGSGSPQVRNGTGNLTITTDGNLFHISGSSFTDGSLFSVSESGFTDGPYVVDDATPVPTTTPTTTPTWDMRTPTNTPTPTPRPHPWPMFRHNAMHTGLSSHAGTSVPVFAWSYVISSDYIPEASVHLTMGARLSGAKRPVLLTIRDQPRLHWEAT
ncbi:MAG: hypothetical protein P8123_09895, partial [bacterium]